MSYQSVNKWRKGKSIQDIQNLYLLSHMLGVKMDDLIVGVGATTESSELKLTEEKNPYSMDKKYIAAQIIKGFCITYEKTDIDINDLLHTCFVEKVGTADVIYSEEDRMEKTNRLECYAMWSYVMNMLQMYRRAKNR